MNKRKSPVHTWGLGTDGLQSQVLGMNFALVVWIGHHRRGERHVAYMTHLWPIGVSIVAVLLTETHGNMNHVCDTRRTVRVATIRPFCSGSYVSELKVVFGWYLRFSGHSLFAETLLGVQDVNPNSKDAVWLVQGLYRQTSCVPVLLHHKLVSTHIFFKRIMNPQTSSKQTHSH